MMKKAFVLASTAKITSSHSQL